MSLVLTLALVAQAAGWVAVPSTPAVGDTVWVQRVVALPAGWVVRPSAWTPEGTSVESLGPAVSRPAGVGSVRVGYPLVVWEPGALVVTPPPVWRIGPAGEADSVESEPVTIAVKSLVPEDSITPRPPRAPLERDVHAILPLVVSIAVGGIMVLGAWRFRRRPVRVLVDAQPSLEHPVSLGATGNARVDAARLAMRLRTILAQRVPAAHGALTTEECLAVVAAERPEWPLDELRATLGRLDAARFAPAETSDLPALAEEVGALEQVL